jgi:hypothetical protein
MYSIINNFLKKKLYTQRIYANNFFNKKLYTTGFSSNNNSPNNGNNFLFILVCGVLTLINNKKNN